MTAYYWPGHPVWETLVPDLSAEALGFIPMFLSNDDERPAREQLRDGYLAFAGATYRPSAAKFKLSPHGLKFPGDPIMRVLAQCKLRKETIRLYEGSWVAVIQEDGSFEAARMD